MILFFTVVFFIFGLCIGSFLNALNFRVVFDKSLSGRSFCPHCKHQLSWRELVPVVSFLIQGGRCIHCKKKISPRYPLVELSTGLIFALATYHLFSVSEPSLDPILFGLHLFFWLILSAAFVGVAAADLSWGIIPDKIVFPAILVTLIYRIVEPLYRDGSFYLKLAQDTTLGPYLIKSGYFANIVSSDVQNLVFSLLVGGSIAAFFLLLIYFTKGAAMGLGDVKLGFLIGFALGWPAGVTSLFVAFLTGAVVSTILILVRRKRFGDAVPFGPFLSLGALVSLFWGQQILENYLRFFK